MAKGLAVISGSSTVVFKALENGNITLGQDIAANVVVSGSLKLQVSGYAADKFLMSDAEGNATWVTIQASQIDTGNGQDLEARLSSIEAGNGSDVASLETRLSAEESTSRAAESSLESKISTEISALVDGAPEVLDTLNELAAALSDNPNFATDVFSGQASLTARVSGEESVRASADSSLEGKISSEESVRASADSSLESRLSSEESVRASADASLEAKISSGLDDGLSAEASVRASADASLEAKIDADVSALADNTITVNGTANELEVDGGLQAVITLGDASSTITLGLPDDVVVSNSLTVNGDATLGDSTADQLTINAKMRVTLVDRVADAGVLTSYSDSAALAAGDFDGHMFYLKGDNAASGMFQQGNKWYFCEGGVWHSSFFYVGV